MLAKSLALGPFSKKSEYLLFNKRLSTSKYTHSPCPEDRFLSYTETYVTQNYWLSEKKGTLIILVFQPIHNINKPTVSTWVCVCVCVCVCVGIDVHKARQQRKTIISYICTLVRCEVCKSCLFSDFLLMFPSASENCFDSFGPKNDCLVKMDLCKSQTGLTFCFFE